jgi:hypothetical protein
VHIKEGYVAEGEQASKSCPAITSENPQLIFYIDVFGNNTTLINIVVKCPSSELEWESFCGPIPCINQCHGRGKCVLGKCDCHSGYAGFDCGCSNKQTSTKPGDSCTCIDGMTWSEDDKDCICTDPQKVWNEDLETCI